MANKEDQNPQTPEGMSEKEKAKERRKEEKRRRQEERERKRLQQARAHIVNVSWEEFKTGSKPFGHLPLLKANQTTQESFEDDYTDIKHLNAADWDGKTVKLRCRVHTTRGSSKVAFMLLRQGCFSVQAVTAVDEEGTITRDMVKYSAKLTKESIVDVFGVVRAVEQEVQSATQKDIEVAVHRIYTLSEATAPLPLQVEDAARREPAPGEESTFDPVGREARLDYRVLDTRVPAHIGIFRLQSAVGHYFRDFLLKNDFVEIHTPKLIASASEGGADVFEVKYFGGKAYLAQSPQLYKQMAVNADLMRVFEIGPVFRAENSNTHRHLTEFVGLDMEMAFHKHYSEVLDMIDSMFVHIFENIKTHYAKELEVIQQQYPFEPIVYKTGERNLRLTYTEALQLLREDGLEIEDETHDIDTEEEKRLGRIIKEKYGVDFYCVDKFPMKARAFYTMEDPENPTFSNGYDFFLRGEEICSGAQRIHDAELLVEKAKEKGVDLTPLQAYVDTFKYGAYPHAGCGIGLERVVMLYLGIGNVRKTSLFPRAPNRLTP